MAARVAGLLLSLALLVPHPALALNFACGLGEGAECNCGGPDDCRDLRKSGMCSSALTCKTIYGVLACTCRAALSAGNASRAPVPPKLKKFP